jgi:DNA polymerase III subunit delta
MKVATKDIERFVKSPPKGLRAVLVFGADEGMVRLRRDALLTAYGIDRTDPFASTELDAHAVEETPSLLFEALQAMTLTGQAPCVMVSNAGHKISDTMRDALATPTCSNLLLLTAGDLSKGTLRTLFEDAKRTNCATIACYRDEGTDLAATLRTVLQEKGIRAERPAMEALTSLLGNDRAVTLRELEKIDLYLGAERNLTEEVVHTLLSDNQHLEISDAAMSWLMGDMARFLTLCDRLFRAGEHPVVVVRFLLNGAMRLLGIHQQLSEGKSPEAAMMAARPPVFYKEQPKYARALKRFSAPELLRLISALHGLEAEMKRTSTPELLFLQRLTLYA